MEKKWLDQVQNHVKEKYLIADLQKEVLLWKGKFKHLLDRIQGIECDARRDFDYTCRRSSVGENPSDFLSSKEPSSIEKASVLDAPGRIVHVPVTCGVPVIPRDRSAVPQVYRPEPAYIYGYPSQAIHRSALVQNGQVTPLIPPEYYDVRRDAAEVSREQVVVAKADEPEEEKDVDVDVEGKSDGQIEQSDEDLFNKRLVIGGSNKSKIIVRKRADPSRFGSGMHHKRKRLSR